MSASNSHSSGVHFDNGYQSDGLAHILEFVMQRQDAFALPLNRGRQGLRQISTPTQEAGAAAVASVSEAFDCLGSVLAQPVAGLNSGRSLIYFTLRFGLAQKNASLQLGSACAP